MKHYSVRPILLASLAALALTLCLPAQGNEHRDPPMTDIPPLGFVPGQTLRVTVAHIRGKTGKDQPPPDVQVGVWLLDSSGRAIAQSAQLVVPRGEFRSFDFNRTALNLPGEPGTGRLQVRARLIVRVTEPYRLSSDARASGLLESSLELIDDSTGKTAAVWVTVGFFEVMPTPNPP